MRDRDPPQKFPRTDDLVDIDLRAMQMADGVADDQFTPSVPLAHSPPIVTIRQGKTAYPRSLVTPPGTVARYRGHVRARPQEVLCRPHYDFPAGCTRSARDDA